MKQRSLILITLALSFSAMMANRLAVQAATENASSGESIHFRLYRNTNTTPEILKLDTYQEVLGPAIRIDDRPCSLPHSSPNSQYSARILSFNGDSLLSDYPLGDLKLAFFSDLVDSETGTLQSGPETPPENILDVCLPAVIEASRVEIYEVATKKVKVVINIEGITQSDLPNNPPERNVPAEVAPENQPAADKGFIRNKYLLLSFGLVFLGMLVGGVIWKLRRPKA